ncbi:MAG: ABC transporter substrate-binding protein, partial [Rhodothermales bacterium]
RFHDHYKSFFIYEQPFLGSGREKAPPANLESVRIGVLAPLAESHEAYLGERMLGGAAIAIEEANQQGGYGGLPYELVVRNDVGPWGASSNKLVELNDESVWAVLGSIDGQSTHIALRAALKAELPIVTSGSTDPTLTETRIPWLVRVNADDRQMSYALAWYVYKIMGHQRVAVLRVNNRYGRVGVVEFQDGSRRLGHPLLFELRYEKGDTDFRRQLDRIEKSSADALLLWTDPEEGALILKQMREMGIELPVYANDRIVEPSFIANAGEAAVGLVAAYPYDPGRKDADRVSFFNKYAARFGEKPDWVAAHAYDGMRLILESIERSGLNRTRIRDVLTSYHRFDGITGEIILDPTRNDIGPVMLARLKDGTFEFIPSPLPDR